MGDGLRINRYFTTVGQDPRLWKFALQLSR
jgi:hypothetical protein